MIQRILLWLSFVLLFSIPWEDMISLPLIGSLARLAGIVVFGFWALKVLLTGRIRKPHPFHAVFFIFVLWNLASLFWTNSTAETTTRIMTYVQLFVMTVILWDIYRTPALLNAGLQAYILGAWVGVISMLNNYLSGVTIDAYEVGRYSPSGVNAGDFVVILTLGMPAAWYLASSANTKGQNRLLRLIDYAYIPVSGFVIFLTGSRLALFTIFPALLYIFGTTIHPKRILTSAIVILVVAGLLLAMYSFVPPATWERLTTAKSSITAGDLGGRVPIWKECLRVFQEHPFLGVGAGAFRVVNPYKSAAHNTYLSVLAELGVVGFLLFLSLLAVVAYSILVQPKTEFFLWLTTILILLTGISVQTWEFTKTTFLIFGWAVMGANFMEHQPEAETQPARTTAIQTARSN